MPISMFVETMNRLDKHKQPGYYYALAHQYDEDRNGLINYKEF
jgi:hypothetical protein